MCSVFPVPLVLTGKPIAYVYPFDVYLSCFEFGSGSERLVICFVSRFVATAQTKKNQYEHASHRILKGLNGSTFILESESAWIERIFVHFFNH